MWRKWSKRQWGVAKYEVEDHLPASRQQLIQSYLFFFPFIVHKSCDSNKNTSDMDGLFGKVPNQIETRQSGNKLNQADLCRKLMDE